MKPSKDYTPTSPFMKGIYHVLQSINRFLSSAIMKTLLMVIAWWWLSPLILIVDRKDRLLSRKAKYWLIVFSPLTFWLCIIWIIAILFMICPQAFFDAYMD